MKKQTFNEMKEQEEIKHILLEFVANRDSKSVKFICRVAHPSKMHVDTLFRQYDLSESLNGKW
ncbi:hypothetical protein EsVE80_01290 [Enterococcus saigonensis]|uniref:Uncharacterized protein n=1 Tax=Enterococcus saigonensis TaxID=1805431 RepID=A0A679IHI2_9ENTE|nr:hypothetical protein EsVE80_01290 [Enterococcus saigonensis]